jgi:GNAT superfamily N-acetyltransferase
MAVQLVQERLSKGEPSGYYFLFVEINTRVVAYSCYGPIPCTKESYDLHWIAVLHEFRGRGIGRDLLKRTNTNQHVLSTGLAVMNRKLF